MNAGTVSLWRLIISSGRQQIWNHCTEIFIQLLDFVAAASKTWGAQPRGHEALEGHLWTDELRRESPGFWWDSHCRVQVLWGIRFCRATEYLCSCSILWVWWEGELRRATQGSRGRERRRVFCVGFADCLYQNQLGKSEQEKWRRGALSSLANYFEGDRELSSCSPAARGELISGRLCWAAHWCQCSRCHFLERANIKMVRYIHYSSGLLKASDVLYSRSDPSLFSFYLLSFYFPLLFEFTLPPSNLCDQLRLLLWLHQDVTSNLLFVLTPSLLAISEEDIHYA